MSSLAGFRMLLGIYYLSLGVWLGALVMLAVAAPTIFRTVRAQPITIDAPPYNQPELREVRGSIFAGLLVGSVLRNLAVVQALCAALALCCLLLQSTLFADRLAAAPGSWINWLRVALVVLPSLILLADVAWISPRMWRMRSAMYSAQLDAPERNQAKLEFDRLHKLDESAVKAAVFLLLAALLVSPWVLTPADPVSPSTTRKATGNDHG